MRITFLWARRAISSLSTASHPHTIGKMYTTCTYCLVGSLTVSAVIMVLAGLYMLSTSHDQYIDNLRYDTARACYLNTEQNPHPKLQQFPLLLDSGHQLAQLNTHTIYFHETSCSVDGKVDLNARWVRLKSWSEKTLYFIIPLSFHLILIDAVHLYLAGKRVPSSRQPKWTLNRQCLCCFHRRAALYRTKRHAISKPCWTIRTCTFVTSIYGAMSSIRQPTTGCSNSTYSGRIIRWRTCRTFCAIWHCSIFPAPIWIWTPWWWNRWRIYPGILLPFKRIEPWPRAYWDSTIHPLDEE